MTPDSPALGRDRAVLVAAAVVLVLAAVGAVVLLTGGDDDRDALVQTTLTPSATTPSAEPTATATRTAAPSPPPGQPVGWELSAAFLSPEEASAAELEGWAVDADHEPGAGPVLDPCAESAFPLADALTASGERAMRSTREAGGSVLVQELFRYGGDAAAEAFDAYVERVAGCPEAPAVEGSEDSTLRFEVVDQDDDDDGVRTALVRLQPCEQGTQCVEHFRSYVLVAQSGDGLTVASYMIGEDGDPRDDAEDLLEAVAERLATATR